MIRHPLFMMFVGLFAAAAALLVPALGAQRALLVGFDIAAAVFGVTVLATLGRAPADRLRASAARNDAGRGFLLAVTGITCLVILVALGLELGRRSDTGAVKVAMVVVTLLLAWTFGNLVFAIHYARMFYDRGSGGGDQAGLAFPGTPEPDLLDFCYFAFVLGMTFQVSDVEIASRRIRRTATLHGIVAFLFNIGIVALTVNVIAGAT